MKTRAAPASPIRAVTPAPAATLQRACTCGQHTGGGGECMECKKKREQGLQRAAIDASPVNEVPPIVHEVLRSPGQPLDAQTRAFMEPRFGHDFNDVRVHTNSQAARSAQAVRALAYTVGNHIVFGAGNYAPSTENGQRLVAHELTHVVQQAQAGQSILNRKGLEETENNLKGIKAKESVSLTIVPRAAWSASAPDKSKGWDEYPAGKPLPLYRIIIHHTADPLSQTVKELQDKEMKDDYADMPYHFVITENGNINEGRQIEAVGAHAGEIPGNKDITKDPDWGSIGIVLTGDFESRKENFWSPDTPTPDQLGSLEKLLNDLMLKHNIPAANIFKHTEVRPSPTACPGRNLAPHVDSLRKKLAKEGKETTDVFNEYFSLLQSFSMEMMLSRLAAFGNADDIAWLLTKYAPYIPKFGVRPHVAMRALLVHLKGTKATKQEREEVLAEIVKEFPSEKGNVSILLKQLVADRPSIYRVKSGESLNQIAAKFGITVEKLKAANSAKLRSWKTSSGKGRRVEGFNAGDEIVIPPLLSGETRQGNPEKEEVIQRSPSSQTATRTISPVVYDVLHSPGQPLDSRVRGFFESRFLMDFGAVRVHTDIQASQSAQSINALAYTHGRDVVFGMGSYSPGTEIGKRLLAHELAHFAQQEETHIGNLSSTLVVNDPDGQDEREATLIAESEMQRVVQPFNVTHGFGQSSNSIQRQTEEEEDPGQKRAEAAKQLVEKLKKAGAVYKQESGGRDWNNYAISDCSKFVQWVLEGAGQANLFGRENATTSVMQEAIKQLSGQEEPAFRKSDPKAGDILMWEKHVGVVVEIVEKKGTKYLVYADMGLSGASLKGKSLNKKGEDIYWLKADDTEKIDSMGSGGFLGFWTP